MSSGFVSEKALDEQKRQRQEEWDRVRKAEDPKQAPEPEYDSRSLYDQLQANKTKAQEEWDEAHKLKNQIRGIDDDEADFLDQVDDMKSRLETERLREEKKALDEVRMRQEELREKELQERLRYERTGPTSSNNSSKQATKRPSQSKLILGAVKRSNSKTDTPTSPTESKDKNKPKQQETLGALAGLGEYSSSSDADSD